MLLRSSSVHCIEIGSDRMRASSSTLSSFGFRSMVICIVFHCMEFHQPLQNPVTQAGTARLNDWNGSPNLREISGPPRHLRGMRKDRGISGIARLNDRNGSPETCDISGVPDH